MSTNYSQYLVEICKIITNEANKYNISVHYLAKENKEIIFDETHMFPESTTFAFRIRAIEQNIIPLCKQCGKIHGIVEKIFCNHKCYIKWKQLQPKVALTEEKILQTRIDESLLKYTNENNYEWVECKICGYRAPDLGGHYSVYHELGPNHGYQTKCQRRIDAWLKENNPGWQHGGKLSPWSLKSEVHSSEVIASATAKANKGASENSIRKPKYWMNKGFSEAEAKEKVTWYQSRNLEWFIHYYGVEEGTRRFKLKTERWMNSYVKCNYSKISQELFKSIMQIYQGDVYFAEYDRPGMERYINKEYVLKTNNSFVRPDFIDINKKRILEFDGDYWHSEQVANPTLEENRDNSIIEMGYEIFHIKEFEYNKDKHGIIQKCIDFLNK